MGRLSACLYVLERIRIARGRRKTESGSQKRKLLVGTLPRAFCWPWTHHARCCFVMLNVCLGFIFTFLQLAFRGIGPVQPY